MELVGSTTKDLEQEQRQLQLDVYSNNNSMATHRPVLLHVHGGGWRQGSKNIFYPFETMLVARENWVVVNMTYRLAPAHPYPAQLYDIKRALRWVKQNIHAYGGDPDFIVLSG
jgi:acetyl esterase/lipase